MMRDAVSSTASVNAPTLPQPAARSTVRSASLERSALAARLRREISGEVFFDAASRGRYSTDASIYQIEPVGIVVPRTDADALAAMAIAADAGIPILPRGAGTSQCGQTVGAALVIDNSKWLNAILDFDAEQRRVIVEPGAVLDQLNAYLKPHGVFYPVDVSTAAQATIGGMAGNNSCGSRSLRYGNMVHNVHAIDAALADGAQFQFGPLTGFDPAAVPKNMARLVDSIQAIALREADEIERRVPKLLRRVAGYNLDMLAPGAHNPQPNLAHLLVGSEGTLAYFRRIHLNLSPLPRHKTLGVCHFPTFYQAMDASQHIVKLQPAAVELVDRTMIDLALANASFRTVVNRFLMGEPDAILLVEFAGDNEQEQIRALQRLSELMADLGMPKSVVEIVDPELQRDTWEVRKAGLNIMMSMHGDGKPVSFIEDCAVPLEHLADYTARLTEVFAKHGTRGTWYAHASVGCLHVRPVLNMKGDGAVKMRAIAEEACAMVREYKGSYSGEHGDGLVRSEWIEPMYGARLTRAFGEIKALFDPHGLMNPGKIVNPSLMDDRRLFRYAPGYGALPLTTALDWSSWLEPENKAGALAASGLMAAVEMCNNNGHCRKFDAGTMCPSYRATRDEQHLTRGRANTLRLALSGQLGAEGLASQEVRDALDLCVSCKGCKRECPTGVDMAKLKIEARHHYTQRHGISLRERLVAYLPRYARIASTLHGLFNLRDRLPGAARLSETLFGISAKRSLPRWRADTFQKATVHSRHFPHRDRKSKGRELVLLVDTFSNYFDPEIARAAHGVLEAAGYTVYLPLPEPGADLRPLCCGRTFLASGLVAQARFEAGRTLAALLPYAAQEIPIVGLEPSCLLTLRDEFPSLMPDHDVRSLAENAMLFEEFVATEIKAGRWRLDLKPIPQKTALLHGHCHQKAFGAMGAVEQVLRLIPDLKVETVASSCCGMAGAFGFETEHYDVSMQMGELSLLPAMRAAPADTLLVADGTSCRHQIFDGTQRRAVHVAVALATALKLD
jgi:FAD/FMN-containing dehydrogenase/Fe-S oxidoreductase